MTFTDWSMQSKLDFVKMVSQDEVSKGLAAQGLKIDFKALIETLGLKGVVVELDGPEQMHIGVEAPGLGLTLSIRGKIDDLKGNLDSEPVRKIVKKLLEIIDQLEKERTTITFQPIKLEPGLYTNPPVQFPNVPTFQPPSSTPWNPPSPPQIWCQSGNIADVKPLAVNHASSDATGWVDPLPLGRP